MTARMCLLVAIVCSAVAGCASQVHRVDSKPCNEGTCFLAVSVSDCTIIVDPEQKEIARGNRSAVLHWELDPASFLGYGFAERGIAFGEAGRDQFERPERSSFAKEFTWVDRNTAPGKFKYTVNIVRRWSKEACPPYDPWVINN